MEKGARTRMIEEILNILLQATLVTIALLGAIALIGFIHLIYAIYKFIKKLEYQLVPVYKKEIYK